MSTPDLVLWGVGTPRTVRAHWALSELGLNYKTRAIGPRGSGIRSETYTTLNPRQKIPLLQDGEFTIGESGAIVGYLSHTYSCRENSLIPGTVRGFGVWLEWCLYILTELDSASLYVMRRHSAMALGHIYGVAPDVVSEAAKYFCKQLKHVEVALSDGRPFLLGDQFTSADILLTSCLEWAIDYAVPVSNLVFPYLDRIRERPGYIAGAAANAQPQAEGEAAERL
jgi:glutathione S-transferase